MKLSEAMREGSKKTRQVYGRMFGGKKKNAEGQIVADEACALGAAEAGVSFQSWREQWPWAGDMHVDGIPCPAGCNQSIIAVVHAITHLNDEHHWTRERIADWVEKGENCLIEKGVKIV